MKRPDWYDPYVQQLRAATPKQAFNQDLGRFQTYYAQPMLQAGLLGAVATGTANVVDDVAGDGDLNLSADAALLAGAGAGALLGLRREGEKANWLQSFGPTFTEKTGGNIYRSYSQNVLLDPVVQEEAAKATVTQKVWEMVTGKRQQYNPVDWKAAMRKPVPSDGPTVSPDILDDGVTKDAPPTGGGGSPVTTGGTQPSAPTPDTTQLELNTNAAAAQAATSQEQLSGAPATNATTPPPKGPASSNNDWRNFSGEGGPKPPKGYTKVSNADGSFSFVPDPNVPDSARQQAASSAQTRIVQAAAERNPAAPAVEQTLQTGQSNTTAVDNAGVAQQLTESQLLKRAQTRQSVMDVVNAAFESPLQAVLAVAQQRIAQGEADPMAGMSADGSVRAKFGGITQMPDSILSDVRNYLNAQTRTGLTGVGGDMSIAMPGSRARKAEMVAAIEGPMAQQIAANRWNSQLRNLSNRATSGMYEDAMIETRPNQAAALVNAITQQGFDEAAPDLGIVSIGPSATQYLNRNQQVIENEMERLDRQGLAQSLSNMNIRSKRR